MTRLVVLAALLVLPAAPARADIIGAFLKTIVAPLTSVVGGLNVLQSVLINIETRLPVLMKTIELKNREKLANALAENRREAQRRREQAESVMEFQGDYHGGRCEQVTGGQDIAMIDTVNGGLQREAIRRDVENYSATGVPRGVTGKPPTVDPAKRAIGEYRQHVSQFATKSEAALAAKLTGKSIDDIKENPRAGADTEAATLMATNSFNDDAHFVASMSLCYALTGNSAIPYAQGRALSEHIDNIKQFNEAMSDYATQSIAQYFCFNPLVYRKMPIDNKFAQSNPDFKRQTDDFSQYSASLTTSDHARTPAQTDLRTRNYLLDPQSGGYIEVDPETKVTGQPSMGAKHELIKGQMVSPEQVDEAEFIYKWYSKDITDKLEGVTGVHLGNMYTLHLYKTQLLWRQYEDVEHQLLLEAVALARMTRKQMSEPGMVTPH